MLDFCKQAQMQNHKPQAQGINIFLVFLCCVSFDHEIFVNPFDQQSSQYMIYGLNRLFRLLQAEKNKLSIIMKKNQIQHQIQLSHSSFLSSKEASARLSSQTEKQSNKVQQTDDSANSTKEARPISSIELQKPLLENQSQKKKNKSNKDKQDRKFSWPIWKKLFKYSLKRKYHLFSGLILNLCFALSVSLLPLKVGQVLDLITASEAEDTGKNISDLKYGVLELGVMTILLAFFTFARFLSLQFLQEFLAMDMRTDFYTKFITNDMYFFQQYKSGELVSRLSSDVNQAKSAVSNNLTYMIRNIVIIISNIIILFTLSWKLTLLIMLLVPIYSIITRQYSKRSKILVREYQDVQAEIAATVSEKFSGIQLVKACSTEEQEIANYSNVIKKGYGINKKKIYLQAMYSSCSEFLPYLGIMVVLLYGGSMVIEGSAELTAGQLTSFILYCTSLAHSTSAISSSYTSIINGTYAVQKVFQLLDYQPLVDQNRGAKQIITGDIQFRDVVFKYPTSKTVVLKNVSFKIQRGEYIAFVGESGSGKSTIVKLIEKFYQIESGSIFYGSFDQSELNAIYLRKQIGLVSQQATTFSGNIQDNIAYGVENPTSQQIQQAAQRSGCLEFLGNSKRFPKKFLSEVGQRGNNLSGGQKQRVAIARALIRKPKIIIFDQATSALDSNSQRMVQSSIQSLANIQSADKPTIIVIAHRLSTIINADRIFVMKAGEILQQGTHRYLKNLGGYYYDLIKKQLDTNPELSGDLNLSPPKDPQKAEVS